MIEKWITFFKAHERILIIAACGLIGIHFYTKGFDYLTKHDQTQAEAAAQKLKVDEGSNAVLVQQLGQMRTDFAQQVASLQVQIAKRNEATDTQKKQDAAMTEVQLAVRWAELVRVKPEEVQVSTVPNTLQISDNAAHATVGQLEDLPTCKANLADTVTQLTNANKLATQQNTVIASDVTVLADEKKKHEDDVKVLKDKNHTAYLKGLKHGVIIGASATAAIFIAIFK
jgi:hypothetical protein